MVFFSVDFCTERKRIVEFDFSCNRYRLFVVTLISETPQKHLLSCIYRIIADFKGGKAQKFNRLFPV